MKRTIFSLLAAAALTPVAASTAYDMHAENDANEELQQTSDPAFASEEELEEGFLTHYLNEAIASGMNHTEAKKDMSYGRHVTDYVSAPKFGGYFVGKYSYTNQDGKHTGDGFSQRYTRLYVNGTILRDFAYRIQMQTNNEKFHMKDYFIEWQKYKELRIKVGQYKRAFGFENPMNPWDVGTGDYSQMTKKLAGMSDYIGDEPSTTGGRDQGIQIQGDLFPVGKTGYSLLHYQLMVANGQGVNRSDANSHKDVIGTLQIQPLRGLVVGVFGWAGRYTAASGITVSRNRYMVSAKYDANDFTVRAEYAHSTGHKVSDYQSDGTWSGTGRADAWYATVGIPCTPWLKTYLKYDAYRDDATWGTTKTIYSVAPNIQIHKNLMFQPQFNYVHDRNLAKSDYCELWLETYVRF